MTLKEWLFKRRITVMALARLLSMNRGAIHHWMSGRNKPSAKNLKKIRDITQGEVSTSEQFLDKER